MRIFAALLTTAALSFAILQPYLGAAMIDLTPKGVVVLGTSKKTIPTQGQPGIEKSVFKMVNQLRAKHQLPPLTSSSFMGSLAREHSIDMASGLIPFGHDGVSQRFNAILKKYPNSTSFGENVAFDEGYANPGEEAVAAWINSPPHLANMLGDYNLTGVGVASNDLGEYYFTQIFDLDD